MDADDNKPWCSTLTDRNGQHVGGKVIVMIMIMIIIIVSRASGATVHQHAISSMMEEARCKRSAASGSMSVQVGKSPT